MTTFPFTRVEQVLKVLKAGGYIITKSANGCRSRVNLYDRTGAPVAAWLTALQIAARQCRPVLSAQQGDGTIHTRLEFDR